AWSTPAQNRSPAPRDLGARWDGLAGHRHLAHSARWERARLQEAPQSAQELPRQRHTPALPPARTPLTTPGLIPRRERALGLQAHPAPRHLAGPGPPIALPGLRQPALPASLATLGGRRRQARSRPPLLGRLQSSPRKQCHHPAPGTLAP